MTQKSLKMTQKWPLRGKNHQKWLKMTQKWHHFPILISGKWPPPSRGRFYLQNDEKVGNREVYSGNLKFKREIPILNWLGAPKYWGGVPPHGVGVSIYPSRRSKSHQNHPMGIIFSHFGVIFDILESFSTIGDRFLAYRRSKRAISSRSNDSLLLAIESWVYQSHDLVIHTYVFGFFVAVRNAIDESTFLIPDCSHLFPLSAIYFDHHKHCIA